MESNLAAATSKCCRVCAESNLVMEVRIARCAKCFLLYCTHFASNIDPQYCTECLSDITLQKETIVKTYYHESYDEENDTVVKTEYRRKAKLVRLDGLDWLFAQRKILSMSDEALELAIEYHREILSGMVAEREDRKTKFLHRYAGVRIASSAAAGGQVNVDTSTSSQTEVKKTKTISSTKAAANANAVLQSMMAGGMSPADILKKIEEMQSMIKK